MNAFIAGWLRQKWNVEAEWDKRTESERISIVPDPSPTIHKGMNAKIGAIQHRSTELIKAVELGY